MSKSNDISNMATLEDHNSLADNQLDAVSGGRDSGGFRSRYQLRLDEATSLLSAQPQKD